MHVHLWSRTSLNTDMLKEKMVMKEEEVDIVRNQGGLYFESANWKKRKDVGRFRLFVNRKKCCFNRMSSTDNILQCWVSVQIDSCTYIVTCCWSIPFLVGGVKNSKKQKNIVFREGVSHEGRPEKGEEVRHRLAPNPSLRVHWVRSWG
jgi:hypothetical protein